MTGRSLHARYAPSAAERWSLCPGSVKLTRRIPEGPPPRWTVEGRQAHALLQLCLSERIEDAYFYKNLKINDGVDDFVVDEDHCASVQVVLDHVYELLRMYPDAELYSERYLPVPQTVVPVDDVGGTSDVVVYVPSERRLFVIDFKHGEGVVVEVQDNKQARMYALACLQDFPDPIKDICLTIVQPRAFHPFGAVRSEIVTPRQMFEFQTDMEDWIRECERADAPLVAGDVQCRFCPAKAFCPALEKRALQAFSSVSVPELRELTLPLPQEMTMERIANILDAWDHVEAWFRAVSDYAFEQLKAGVPVPGRKLVLAQARRKWDGDPVEIAEQFMQRTNCDIDDIFPRKLVTITEAEKMMKVSAQLNVAKEFKKHALAKAMEAMSHWTVKDSSGNLVMVPEVDARPAYNASKLLENVAIPKVE